MWPLEAKFAAVVPNQFVLRTHYLSGAFDGRGITFALCIGEPGPTVLQRQEELMEPLPRLLPRSDIHPGTPSPRSGLSISLPPTPQRARKHLMGECPLRNPTFRRHGLNRR